MAHTIPNWLMKRYAKIFNKMRQEEFSYSAAEQMLKEKNKQTLNVVLSQLKKSGWLTIASDKKDSRKKIYRLVDPREVIAAIGKNNKIN